MRRVLLFVAFVGLVVAQQCADVNACSGNGLCKGPNQCTCFDGFGGPACDSTVLNCPNHCSAHGTCLDGICSCDIGFGGEDCSIVMDVCAPALNCTGHGTCFNGACECMDGWSGDKCEISPPWNCPTNLNNCTDRGDCGLFDGAEGSYSCHCELGFCGPTCAIVCPSCPSNCSGHGTCEAGHCTCHAGFAGADCSVVTETPGCPNYCTGHGHCDRGQCKCNEGWVGDDCSRIDPLTELCPSACSNRGQCDNGVCKCDPGFTGFACDRLVLCAGNCSAQGFCEADGNCTCYPGFAGSDCSLACSTGPNGLPCSGNGRCLEDDGKATCYCEVGYTHGVVTSESGVEYGFPDLHACEIEDKSADVLGGYSDGGSPIGIVLLGLLGLAMVVLIGGFTYNVITGKRGLQAIPGYSMLHDQLKEAPELGYSRVADK